MSTTNQLSFLPKLAFALIVLCLFGGIVYIGQDIVVPVAFAILLSVLLLPANQFLEKKKFPRVMAILLSLTVAIILIAALIYFISTQVASFTDDIPAIKKQLQLHFTTLQKWVYQQFHITRKEQTQFISNATEKIKDNGSGLLGETFLSVTQTVMVLVLLPVYSFLILYYRDMIRKFLTDVFGSPHEEKVKEVLRESRSIVQGYMVGLMIELAIVATINSAGFLILGIHYAILLGVIAAILNMIPYIGMLIAAIFCMLVTLTTSSHMGDVIWVAAILTAVQFIDNNIIMPKVVSSKVKINALLSIIGVLIGGALAGIPGMFLSIPVIAIMKVIFDRVDELKPWGMLLGDEITVSTNRKILKRVFVIPGKKKGDKTIIEKTMQQNQEQ
jgi:predicted PurR-regulated permease PerM